MPDGYVHSGHLVASINGKKEDENGVKIENGENGSCEKEKVSEKKREDEERRE